MAKNQRSVSRTYPSLDVISLEGARAPQFSDGAKMVTPIKCHHQPSTEVSASTDCYLLEKGHTSTLLEANQSNWNDWLQFQKCPDFITA